MFGAQAAGYFGKSSDPAVKMNAKTGAKDAKVKSLEIAGFYACELAGAPGSRTRGRSHIPGNWLKSLRSQGSTSRSNTRKEIAPLSEPPRFRWSRDKMNIEWPNGPTTFFGNQQVEDDETPE